MLTGFIIVYQIVNLYTQRNHMKSIFTLLLSILSLQVFASTTSPDSTQISTLYSHFRKLVENHELDSCKYFIDQETYSYFDSLGKVICCGTKEDILSLNATDLTIALTIKSNLILRNETPDTSKLYTFNQLVLLGRQDVIPQTALTQYDIEGNWASATEVLGGKLTDHQLYFIKENGVWKMTLMVDINSSRQMNNIIMANHNNSKEDIVLSCSKKTHIPLDQLYRPIFSQEKP